MKGKHFAIIFTLLPLLMVKKCQAYMHPNILWDPRNPIFNTTKCGYSSRKFSAYIDDTVTVVCGSPKILNTFTDKIINPESFYYNMFVTSDIQTYVKRDGRKSKKIYTCQVKRVVENNEAHLMLVSFSLMSKFRGDINEWENKYAKTFYFFTTSDGTIESVNYTEGVNATKDMRFQLFICNSSAKLCPGRERLNVCPGQLTTMSPLTVQPKYLPKCTKITLYVLLICLALALGFFLGIVAAFMYFCHKNNASKRLQATLVTVHITDQNST